VGEIVKIDDKWRVSIPKRFRGKLRTGDKLKVELRGGDIVLRRIDREDLVKKFESIRLEIDEERARLDAETGKHRYGGIKE